MTSASAIDRLAAPPALLPAVLLRTGVADAYAEHPSPVGAVLVAWNPRGISALRLAVEAPGFEEAFARGFGRRALRAEALPPTLARQLDAAFASGQARNVRYDLRGRSPFEVAVLDKAREIPAGEVRPYGWIAREIERPGAVRAVGTALGRNPVPLLIPCHRVVRTDGMIGNYSLGGPDVKRRLLRHEGVDPDALESLAARRVRLVGSDSTRIYCMPTCRHARRITDGHRRLFHDAGAARDAGYRACRDCRP
jgi:O-6-methylguanine DNA methyltransferase